MSRALAIALAAAALAAPPAVAAKRNPAKPPAQAQIQSSDDSSYADPAREALDPDPARLIESQSRALVAPVDF